MWIVTASNQMFFSQDFWYLKKANRIIISVGVILSIKFVTNKYNCYSRWLFIHFSNQGVIWAMIRKMIRPELLSTVFALGHYKNCFYCSNILPDTLWSEIFCWKFPLSLPLSQSKIESHLLQFTCCEMSERIIRKFVILSMDPNIKYKLI